MALFLQPVRVGFVSTFTFTFSHLADGFYQSDLPGCIHIFTFTLMAHCTSGAVGSVSCSRTLRQGIELATWCLLNDFSTYRSTLAPAPQLISNTSRALHAQ